MMSRVDQTPLSLLKRGTVCFFAISSIHLTAYAAPSIPAELLEKSVVYCTSGEGFTLNPQRADVGSNMNVVTEQLYDKLVEFDPVTNKIKPSLAEHYEVSEDGLSVTFHLRRKVKFHHTDWFTPTRDLNADDVVFSLNRMMGKDLELTELSPTEQASFERYQINRQIADATHFPYFDSTRLKTRIERMFALNAHTVKITLSKPYPALLEHLASQYAVIISKEYALQLNADENLLQMDRLPVGTGVYQVESYAQNDHVRLKPNPHYWGKKAAVENMIVDFSTSGTGRMARFLNNECDVAAFPEPSQLSVLKGRYGSLSENWGANLAFLAFNLQRSTMQDLALRQHISQSINRGRLVRTLFYRSAEVAQSVLPQALLTENNPTGYLYQPRYIDKKWAELEPLNLWVLDEKRIYNPHPLKMAELIRADLASIGIKVKVRQVSRSYLVQQLERGTANYDMILGGWLANNFDYDSFLYPILSCRVQQSVTNLSNWCSTEFDDLLREAQLSSDINEQKVLYRQAQALLQKELPILPLVNAKRVLLVSPKLEKVAISQFGQVNLSQIKRKTENKKGH